MSEMRAFHRWLSSVDGTNDPYRRSLALLAHASCNQIRNLKSNVDWSIWWR